MTQLVLQKSKVAKFEKAFSELDFKFRGYITGELSDSVKLTATNGKPNLKFIGAVPEIVKIACFMVLVETLL
jgi:hypothetical protein